MFHHQQPWFKRRHLQLPKNYMLKSSKHRRLVTTLKVNHITFKTVSGKSKSVTSEMFDGWWETSLPTLSSNYEVKDIYNADEFGLFYECLPNKTYQIKSENSYDGKLSKIRITGLAVANTVGDKWPMFVTGKDKKSWCFKNVNFLHCCYRNQWKCWMNAVLFEEWVRQMEKKFLFEGML